MATTMYFFIVFYLFVVSWDFTVSELSVCPNQCSISPCSCSDELYCSVCHSHGCSQCETGYFRKNPNYPCISCQDTFGEECMFCQDYNGCGQCSTNSVRKYSEECELYYCSCTEKITITSIDIQILETDDLSSYIGDYYLQDALDENGNPIYKHDQTDAEFVLIEFQGPNLLLFWIADGIGSWRFNTVVTTWDETNYPLDGNSHEWLSHSNYNIDLIATFNDCSGKGIDI